MLLVAITPAFALTCAEVMNMVNVNVPPSIVAQTIEESGEGFDPREIECLVRQGAPAEVIAAAKATPGTPQAPAHPPPKPEPLPGPPTVDHPEKADPADAFVLAQALDSMGFANAAQWAYIEVLKRGPDDAHSPYALLRLTTLAFEGGDTSDLSRIIEKIPPEDFPQAVRDELDYLLGLRLYEHDKLTEARKYLDQVGEGSPCRERARYVEAVIYEKQGKLKSGIRLLEALASSAAPALAASSRMDIARVDYSIERWDEAEALYLLAPPSPERTIEIGWARFMLGRPIDPELTKLRDGWLPEAAYVEGVSLYNQRRYGEIVPLLDAWAVRWTPIRVRLHALLDAYGSEEGKTRAEEVYRQVTTDAAGSRRASSRRSGAIAS